MERTGDDREPVSDMVEAGKRQRGRAWRPHTSLSGSRREETRSGRVSWDVWVRAWRVGVLFPLSHLLPLPRRSLHSGEHRDQLGRPKIAAQPAQRGSGTSPCLLEAEVEGTRHKAKSSPNTLTHRVTRLGNPSRLASHGSIRIVPLSRNLRGTSSGVPPAAR